MTRSALWIVVAATLVVFAIAAFVPAVLADGDIWWHVRAGQWILAQGRVPTIDPFAPAASALPWVAHEWLAEVLMALSFRVAGWNGVVLLTASAAAAAFAVVGARLSRDLDRLALACCLALVASLVAAGLLARPHILALPILAIWTSGLLRARDEDRAPSLLLLPLMLLWANLHGGYAFGIALIGPFALEALVVAHAASRWRVIRSWGLFGLSAVAVSIATPHGLEGLLFPFALLKLKSLSLIAEWQPANFATLKPLELVLLALFYVTMQKRVKVPVLRLLLLLGLIHMALSHSRHEMLLGIVGSLILAAPLGRALESTNTTAPRSRAALPVIAALIAVLALAGLRLAIPVTRGDHPAAPVTAMAAVPETLRRQPVLNAYSFGGYLIWLGIAPSIDGRADMYGDALMVLQNRIVNGDRVALDETIAGRDVRWTIYAPDDRVVALLDDKPGWRRIYADRYAVVHQRIAPDAMPRALP